MPSPSYTYSSNIPAATDQLKVSQPQIQENYQAINELINQNHGSFNSDTFGQHSVVQMPVQGSAPVPNGGWADSDVGLYNLLNSDTSIEEMYVHFSNGNPDIPMTASVLSYSSPTSGSSGWTYLPSGVLVKWGYDITASGSSPFTTIFPVSANIPAFNYCFTVILNTIGSSSATNPAYFLVAGSLTNLQFQWSYNTGTASGGINYLAIGY